MNKYGIYLSEHTNNLLEIHTILMGVKENIQIHVNIRFMSTYLYKISIWRFDPMYICH